MDDKEKMHGLWQLKLDEKKQKQFEKKNIHTVDDLLMFLPKDYKTYDYGHISEGCTLFIMHLGYVETRKTNSGIDMLIATGRSNDYKVSVIWFRQNFKFSQIDALRGQRVIVAGNATYDAEWNKYTIVEPDIFEHATENRSSRTMIVPIYSKITGMSDTYLIDTISIALDNFAHYICSDMPKTMEKTLDLINLPDAIRELHRPTSTENLMKAKQRLRAEKMYYFAVMTSLNGEKKQKECKIKVVESEIFRHTIESLPYELTADQKTAVTSIFRNMRKKQFVHALVQGDVGCGKSIIAFLSMILIAENGHQAALMAPTSVLARQHYEDLVTLLSPLGMNVEFVPPLTSLRKKEKEEILKRIKSGESKIIVGTHALLSDEIEYKDLALVITDEEHKFGVEQREKLVKRTAEGVHYISMSATPIPRSLANVVYGDRYQLYLVQTMPPGRKPVKTAISKSYGACFNFIEKQLQEGRQVYVVCPQIESNEKIEGVTSVTELNEIYSERFGENIVCTLTGKNTKKETAQILADFKENKKSILIATTVIEVGVNVPNANTIIIHNAERFGLAALHQLRGRVGRGGGDAYCVLFSEDKDNERLLAMCKTNNGFEIAEEDMRLRGAGNLFGTEQSGLNEYINIIMSHPGEYKEIKKAIVGVRFGKK